ncbi:hypothetical protein PROFUN_00078 [Planoprotostelium fungivorum]|uniref:PAS domain-containing protein n=1 Tax=Planoprotostelium fungivorum TaxID=1890364 RepID=A0A2P6P0K3_9EUKA|nr:hypothetical protein PROFUN_00078 [Planoprotostelium fungivorum]
MKGIPCIEAESKRRSSKNEGRKRPRGEETIPIIPPPSIAPTSSPLSSDFTHAQEATLDDVVWNMLFGEQPNDVPHPPSMHAFTPEEMEYLSKQMKETGHLIPLEPEVAASYRKIWEKLVDLRRFVTPEQKERIQAQFRQQLQIACDVARACDTPTIIWERNLVVHFLNKSAVDLLGWNLPLPQHNRLAFFHFLSPEMGDFIRTHTQKAYMEILSDTCSSRSGFRRLDCQEMTYKMCNFVLSFKRDVLGLPQLFMLQMIPDPEPIT